MSGYVPPTPRPSAPRLYCWPTGPFEIAMVRRKMVPITCRRLRQVRTILFKASMVATDKWPSIIIPHPSRKNALTRREQQASRLSAGHAVHRILAAPVSGRRSRSAATAERCERKFPLRSLKRKTPAGDFGWGLSGMFLLRGDDVLCGKSVLRCEDQKIGILVFCAGRCELATPERAAIAIGWRWRMCRLR
jgi:hypothetical protein